MFGSDCPVSSRLHADSVGDAVGDRLHGRE